MKFLYMYNKLFHCYFFFKIAWAKVNGFIMMPFNRWTNINIELLRLKTSKNHMRTFFIDFFIMRCNHMLKIAVFTLNLKTANPTIKI